MTTLGLRTISTIVTRPTIGLTIMLLAIQCLGNPQPVNLKTQEDPIGLKGRKATVRGSFFAKELKKDGMRWLLDSLTPVPAGTIIEFEDFWRLSIPRPGFPENVLDDGYGASVGHPRAIYFIPIAAVRAFSNLFERDPSRISIWFDDVRLKPQRADPLGDMHLTEYPRLGLLGAAIGSATLGTLFFVWGGLDNERAETWKAVANLAKLAGATTTEIAAKDKEGEFRSKATFQYIGSVALFGGSIALSLIALSPSTVKISRDVSLKVEPLSSKIEVAFLF